MEKPIFKITDRKKNPKLVQKDPNLWLPLENQRPCQWWVPVSVIPQKVEPAFFLVSRAVIWSARCQLDELPQRLYLWGVLLSEWSVLYVIIASFVIVVAFGILSWMVICCCKRWDWGHNPPSVGAAEPSGCFRRWKSFKPRVPAGCLLSPGTLVFLAQCFKWNIEALKLWVCLTSETWISL